MKIIKTIEIIVMRIIMKIITTITIIMITIEISNEIVAIMFI